MADKTPILTDIVAGVAKEFRVVGCDNIQSSALMPFYKALIEKGRQLEREAADKLLKPLTAELLFDIERLEDIISNLKGGKDVNKRD